MVKEWLEKLDGQLKALKSKIEAAEAEHLAAVASGQPELVAAALKARLDRLVKEKELVLGALLDKVVGDAFSRF